jgi:hypothetical protein
MGIVNLCEIQGDLIGKWIGNNLLRLSPLTPSEYFSSFDLSVASIAKGKFLSFNYTEAMRMYTKKACL